MQTLPTHIMPSRLIGSILVVPVIEFEETHRREESHDATSAGVLVPRFCSRITPKVLLVNGQTNNPTTQLAVEGCLHEFLPLQVEFPVSEFRLYKFVFASNRR